MFTATTRTALQALHRASRKPTLMRNPRTVALTPSKMYQHKLSPAQPRPDSLFWHLWRRNEDIATKVLNTSFIQGIAHGTLNPIIYGRYNVSDAYYCYHGAEDYAIAASRTKDIPLKAYLQMKHDSYQKFNATFPETWHLKDASGIHPSHACREYSEFERRVVRHEEPVYAVVAMLPCEFLWAWLGMMLSPAQEGNLYRDWIETNNDASGAYAMGNFLEEFEERGGEVDWEKAGGIYRQAMLYEWENFETA